MCIYYSVLDFLSFSICSYSVSYSVLQFTKHFPVTSIIVCICGRNIVLTTVYSQGTIQTDRDSEIS